MFQELFKPCKHEWEILKKDDKEKTVKKIFTERLVYYSVIQRCKRCGKLRRDYV